MTPRPFRADALVAGSVAVLTGLQLALPVGVTAAAIASIALCPVWLPLLRNHLGARTLFVLCLGALVSGLVLTGLRSSDHGVSPFLLTENSALVANIALTVGVLLWSRHLLGAPRVALLIAVGMLASIPLHGVADGNLWRFTLSIPIAVFALAVATQARNRPLELTALLALAAVSLVNDARSGTAILMITAIVVLWQLVPLPRRDGGRSTLRVVVTIGVTVAVVYSTAMSLIAGGVFGELTRLRTQAQIDTAGSVLLGGRPELGASLALFGERPAGFGSGTLATPVDVAIAKAGMASLGYDPDNGYVENYMFGAGYEVHSVIGDLWLRYGLVGLALAVALVVITVSSVVRRIRFNLASALLIFLGIRMLWNLFFSPLASSELLTILFLTIALPHVSEPGRARFGRHLVRPASQQPTDRGVVLA
ncbi:hypothetical protein [Mycetocola reblochoni]|uniref:O-antigen ligase domain-containing protein n=2 Tax=Mycetocola reblochoni TaxID=331618 RepID=A0A3L6ZMQ9_9MICO|nr:hypothetical protein [Mycetocola reblochoni]RLP68955.1 hypothetical protein D9V30_08765 [Mycetocola reblochoni]SJN18837.1 putative integral membrane protein [Mycetocola reblochoni REB411]